MSDSSIVHRGVVADRGTPSMAEGFPLTRRGFLTRVGQLGGAVALYETMVVMGLLGPIEAWAGPPQLHPGQGEGKSVLILGAGIGGLTTAYILSQYGYKVRILEASSRAGGRNHTARRGDTVVEQSQKNGRTVQVCKFDPGLYMNLGPGRLPYHHRRVLGYCQALEVKLEPYVMHTTGNLFQSAQGFAGKPIAQRQIQNDTRGYIAELLAKVLSSTDPSVLDGQLDAGEKKKLLALLVKFGNLGARTDADAPDNAACPAPPDYRYQGSTRAGCAPSMPGGPTPNVDSNCEIPPTLSRAALLDAEFWDNGFYDPLEFEWQPTLFQPVGGMDKIVEGFLRKVGHLIEYNAQISAIKATPAGVTVTWMRGTVPMVESADYCVSNIPCPILARLDTNFPDDKEKRDGVTFWDAVTGTTFVSSCKVGWQTNTRFWENDKNEIYGGISWTDDVIEQIWYPSNDYFAQKGTLTGAYIHDGRGPCGDGRHATEFGELGLAQRLAKAKEGAARLHAEFNDDSIVPTALGLSVAWQNVVHQEGAWPAWNEKKQKHNEYYRRLLRPFQGRFFIVGDQASTLPGWQEGAMMSAEHVVALIAGLKTEKDIAEDIHAPTARWVTQGAG